jgi:hypothetical protein
MNIPECKDMKTLACQVAKDRAAEVSEKLIENLGEIIYFAAKSGESKTQVVLKDSEFWPEQMVIESHNYIKSKLPDYVVTLIRGGGDASLVISWL